MSKAKANVLNFCNLAIIFLMMAASLMASLDPSKDIREFHQDVWGIDQGLPQNSVYTILQTSDGYVWFGTELGLGAVRRRSL